MKSFRDELELIYDKFRQQMFICALAITGCQDVAEDAIHKAFCQLLQLKHSPQNLKAYIFKCVRNAAIDLIRQNARMHTFSDDYIFEPTDSPREVAEKKEFQQRVGKALLTLSEDERETIVQHLFTDLTFREIAEMRNLPIGTVTSWYHRGLANLREKMEE